MYVQRNQAGAVVGVYANEQPGIAAERLADDHADIVAFRDFVTAPAQAERQTFTLEDVARAVVDPQEKARLAAKIASMDAVRRG